MSFLPLLTGGFVCENCGFMFSYSDCIPKDLSRLPEGFTDIILNPDNGSQIWVKPHSMGLEFYNEYAKIADSFWASSSDYSMIAEYIRKKGYA